MPKGDSTQLQGSEKEALTEWGSRWAQLPVLPLIFVLTYSGYFFLPPPSFSFSERKGERNINLLFFLFMHSLAGSYMWPNQQPQCIRTTHSNQLRYPARESGYFSPSVMMNSFNGPQTSCWQCMLEFHCGKSWYKNVLLLVWNSSACSYKISTLHLSIKEKELLFFKYNYNCKFWVMV